MLKIYLAGPDVFKSDAEEIGERLKTLCLAHGFRGLWPLDNEASQAKTIYISNVDAIHESDVILANISPFRGADADPGTAYEIGYATALGKKIFLYSDCAEQEYKERVYNNSYYPKIENFKLHQNLMLQHGGQLKVYKSVEEALEVIKREL